MKNPPQVWYAFDEDDRKAHNRTIAKARAIKANAEGGASRPAKKGGVMDQLRAGRVEADFGDCPF